MQTSIYDPYLLISKGEEFGLISMQTDNTLIISDKKFLDKEEEEREKANFQAKPKEQLSPKNRLIFNSCVVRQEQETLAIS